MSRSSSLHVAFFSACALLVVLGPANVRADAASEAKKSAIALAQKLDPTGNVTRANQDIVALEYDRARAELARADAADPAVVLTKARLALYEEDCDLAAALLQRPDVLQLDDARHVADVARGCARVIAATVVEKDEANGVVIRYQDEADRALGPLLVDTVQKARASLSRDLGVAWKTPTRITVVRDLLSLSAMTGLPYKAAQTTGTVAVAKWGRVTILSPRASHGGFAVRDTLAHELTHLAISMQSRERAPLWLHEGVARRQEVRWREPGPFDDRPSPESVVLRGVELKLDLPLDKLGPSIAMLPSADAATVAFAEVTSFIRFFAESSAPDALSRLLVELADATDADAALRQVSGESLAQWDVRWRAHLGKRPKEPLSALYGLGAAPSGLGDSRERARLAELLVGRAHPREALVELEKIPSEMLADPSLRYLRARALEGDGAVKQAEALVEDPKQWIASHGPCWAIRGRLARLRGAAEAADMSFAEAVASDPLAVESACQVNPAEKADGLGGTSAPLGTTPRGTFERDQGAALCDAARARREPDVGRD